MKNDDKAAGSPPDKTPPALRLLKQMWKIADKKPEREMPPPEVAHDIYCVPEHKPIIPQRAGSRRTTRKSSDF